MRALIVVEGITPPGVFSTGMSAIYQLQQKLHSNDLEIEILTVTNPWTDLTWKNWAEKEYKKTGLKIHVLKGFHFKNQI